MARRDRLTLAIMIALMATSGVLHFVAPGGYRRIVPRVLGHDRELVAASGAAELLCAAMMLLPRTRVAGGWLTALVLIAVFPANVQMALDGGVPGAGFPLGSPLVAWLRLPVQLPLILAARRVARLDRLRGRRWHDPTSPA